MSTQENANVASAQATAKKVIKRGVSNSTIATANLKFTEADACKNRLFIGHLHEVRVDWSNNSENKDFPNMSIPRITFHFASNHDKAKEQRNVYMTLFPIASNVDTIPGGKEEWKVNNVLRWIKHMLDVFYLRGRELTEAEEEALSLPFVDFDEEGNYVSVDPEEVLKGYRFVFDNVVAMLNGSFNLKEGETAKACYKASNGAILPIWMKLLRAKKNKGEWRPVMANGDLGFDSFIGEGCIELLEGQNLPKILKVDVVKESITPQEYKKTPSIGIPGAPMMGGVMPTSMSEGMGMGSEAYNASNAAGVDMPF